MQIKVETLKNLKESAILEAEAIPVEELPKVNLSEDQIQKLMGMVDEVQIFKKEIVIVLAGITMKLTNNLFHSILVLKDFLGALARLVTRQGYSVNWETPNGFRVRPVIR
jgi:hypothetical protein